MIGLKIEIDKRKVNGISTKDTDISLVGISKILNTNFNKVKRKVNNGTFTVEEAIKIFNALNFNCVDKFDALEYLFTDQGEGK